MKKVFHDFWIVFSKSLCKSTKKIAYVQKK